MAERPTILVFTRWYLPGHRAGGPVQSLSNFIDRFGKEFAIRVITMDRDLGDTHSYTGVDLLGWNPVGNASVKYCLRKNITLLNLRRQIRSLAPDVIYLNSFFDPLFTQRLLLLRRIGAIPAIPIVLAPRGEFSLGALGIKRWRKLIYLAVTKSAGMYRRILWQASTPQEAKDIRRAFASVSPKTIIVAKNLAPSTLPTKSVSCSHHAGTPLHLCFLSRISRMKNLDFALSCLREVRSNVSFTIYGPIEDIAYWEECQHRIAMLPINITIEYGGELAHQDVTETLRKHDLFFLPTRGENYGHVVLEALTAGLPVLLSDQTPWLDLERHGVGWAFPLSDIKVFSTTIDLVASLPTNELLTAKRKAMDFAATQIEDSDTIEANRQLFRRH